MIRQIRYNFEDLEMACAEIIDSDGRKGLDKLKKELNAFFKDSKCKDILFTRSDSLFFGMCVYPHVTKDLVIEILQDDKKVRFSEYTIEIDYTNLISILNSNIGNCKVTLKYETIK